MGTRFVWSGRASSRVRLFEEQFQGVRDQEGSVSCSAKFADQRSHLSFTAVALQLSHKDKEAEFWRIVEDGEDVVEVRGGKGSCV